MAVIGQEVRVVVLAATGHFRVRSRKGRPAGGWHAIQRRSGEGAYEDHSLRVPAAPAKPAVRDIADLLRRAAVGRDLLELVFGKKGYEAAIGRPERIASALTTPQWPRVRCVEVTHPQRLLRSL